MTNRAAATDRTRAAIVAAAVELHSAHGIAATSWEDIAARAGVSQATAYRHFPNLAALVPDCARLVFVDIAQIPTAEAVTSMYAGHQTVGRRVAHLVESSAHCYERAERWLHAMFCEAPHVPEMADAVLREQRALAALLAGALNDAPVDSATFNVVRVLIDFPFYKQLRDSGLSRAHAATEMTRLALATLTAAGVPGTSRGRTRKGDSQ